MWLWTSMWKILNFRLTCQLCRQPEKPKKARSFVDLLMSSLLLSIENPVVSLWTSISMSQQILPSKLFRRKLKCFLPVPLHQRPCRGSSKFPSPGKDQEQHSVMRDTVCLSWSLSLLPRTYLGLQSCYCICVCMVAIDVLEMDRLNFPGHWHQHFPIDSG